MKKIILLFIFCSSVAFAQENSFKKLLNGVDKVRIVCDTDVTVITGNSSELVLSEGRMVKDETNQTYTWTTLERRENIRAKGLRPVYPGGDDTTDGMGFNISSEGGVLTIKDLKSHFQRHDIKLVLPANMDVDIEVVNLGSVQVEGMTSEVEVKTNTGRVNLFDVEGPITAHTATGTITVVFDKVSQSAPITLTSATGEIDVAIPENTKATLNLDTNRTIYTNFDFKAPSKKGLPNQSGLKKLEQELNGGGVKIKLKSAMGNIYLRKKE
jgi:hypothetical protein